MTENVPRGYFSPEEAIEYFGRRLKFAGRDTTKLSEIGQEALKRELEKTEKASSKQEIQQLLRHLLFEEIISAKLLTDYGKWEPFPSSNWLSIEVERIFATGQSSVSGGPMYFEYAVYGRVHIEQSSIDALFDVSSGDPETGGVASTSKRHPLTDDERDKGRRSSRHGPHLQKVINNIVAELNKIADGKVGAGNVIKHISDNASLDKPMKTGVDDFDFIYWDESKCCLHWRNRKKSGRPIAETTLPRYVTKANRSL